jgi:muconolactone delta-isomerase
MRPILWIFLLVKCMAQQPHMPDLDAQRAAMKKLEFLVGKWSGEGRALRGAGELVPFLQTEDVTFKLDGLVLLIEGVGRSKTDGKVTLQALGVVSYDDETKTYHMRAFNDGRFLETEVKLVEKGMTWGFTVGQYQTKSVMMIDEKGDWTELHEIMIGSQPPRKLMELKVSRLPAH